MRKLIVAAFLLATTLASSADVVIDELLVRRQDSNVNIRVNLHNPSADAQQGPIDWSGLQAMLHAGQIEAQTYLFCAGMEEWHCLDLSGPEPG